MKLLLTSDGLANSSITDALLSLAKKPFSELRIAFIPTAANVEAGNKFWLLKDFNTCHKIGFKEFDIVDISALPKQVWQPRLEQANVLLFGGGNSFHLMYWMKKSGLQEMLPKLLKTRVYVGISAGSMIATKDLRLSNQYKKEFTEQIGEEVNDDALGYVPFLLRPHLNNPSFPNATIKKAGEISQNLKETIYAIDYNTAIKIDQEKLLVVSEGTWEKFN